MCENPCLRVEHIETAEVCDPETSSRIFRDAADDDVAKLMHVGRPVAVRPEGERNIGIVCMVKRPDTMVCLNQPEIAGPVFVQLQYSSLEGRARLEEMSP